MATLLFFTTAAAGHAATLIGDAGVEATQNQMGAGWAMAYPFTATSTGNGTGVTLYFNGSNLSTATEVGVYTNSAGSPSTLLGYGTIANGGQSRWATATMPTVSLTAGTTYFLALLSTSGQLYYNDMYPGNCTIKPQLEASTTLTSLPTTWSTGSSWNACPASVYVTGSTTSPPSDSALPVVSGSASQGSSLTATSGTWYGGPTSYHYQWQDCDNTGSNCSNITGATSSTYTLAQADVDQTVRVAVTATNSSGTSPASASAATAFVSPKCSLYASPSGSDATGAGSTAAPYATPTKLDQMLSPGQTGCLESGTYGSPSTEFDFYTNGTGPNSAISITSAPGVTAQVDGFLYVGGNYTTLENLSIDGNNTSYTQANACGVSGVSQPLSLQGQNDLFQYNTYTQSGHFGNAVLIGGVAATPPNGTVVRYNKIHDVGSCKALDHLIYLSAGAGVKIYGNWMWNDPHGFGVQIYPCPTGASIYSNVIDGAVSGFVEESDGCTVSGNAIVNNVVINSVGSTYAGTSGQGILTCCSSSLSGDTFDDNDVYNNPGGVGSGATGLTLTGNITSNPLFADAVNHNYTLQAGSPVASYGLWNGQS